MTHRRMKLAGLALMLALFVTPRAHAQCPALAGFAGDADYGVGVVPKDDDGSSAFIDLTSAFPDGLSFFGASYSGLFININGDLTFDDPYSGFTPFPFPSDSGTRMIAVFFTDVDTRTPAGASNNIYYHLDPIGHRFIITWLDVERFNVDASGGLDTFQIVLTARPELGPGDFDVEYRYEAVNWIGSSSGGFIPAQIGFDAGNGTDFASHPASRTAAVANIDVTASNHASDCEVGSFAYFIRSSCGNDQVDAFAQEECDPLGTSAGCSSLCTVNPGFACTYVDGQPSTCASGCGNGVRSAATEECDDGNNTPGDGCSNLCRIEPGATCNLSVQPSNCTNTCAVDGDCAAGAFCGSNLKCQPVRPIGQVCERDAMCSTAACADGVCCDVQCDGGCAACDGATTLGTCTPFAPGTDAAACAGFLCEGTSGTCPSMCGDDDDCAASYFCNAGACVPDVDLGDACPRNAACGAATCVDDVCCNTTCGGACDRCDLDGSAGTCTPEADGTFVAACGVYACDGVSANCPATCAGDGDCAADHFCDASVCAPDRVQGGACDHDGMCASGSCADDVCCGSACAGACDRCDLVDHVGACTLVDDGTFVPTCGAYACDGASAACPSACAGDGDCAADHYCDAAHTCVPDLAVAGGCDRDAACASGSCADGVCCNSSCSGACDRCDLPNLEGTCTPLADGTFVLACGVYACDGVAAGCPTTCAGDGDCAADHYCDAAHTCVPDLVLAGACDRDGACASGSCADGVCCDSACSGDCDRCDLGALTGTCSPVVDGTFVGACGAYACDGASVACPTTCASDGDCAASHFCAAGVCVLDKVAGGGCDRDAQCGAASCVDAVCCTTACDGACDRCDGAVPGTCSPVVDGTFVGTCGAYACNGVTGDCPTTCAGDGDCAASHFCDGSQCVPDKAQAGSCDRGVQCQSGACADGVCCNSACGGSCDRCDLSASVGTCTAVFDGTFVAACGAFACDGVSANCPTTCVSDGDCALDHFCDAGGQCALDLTPGVTCARTAQCGAGTCVDAVCCTTACGGACDRCDGAVPGTCLPMSDGTFVGTCGAYACDGVAAGCPTTCASDADCAADHFCGGGACVPDEDAGGACDRVAQCASGSCADGVCCDTACTGGCDRCDLVDHVGACTSLDDGVPAASCGAYLCDGDASCPTTCAGDGDCVADHFCDAGACVPDRVRGGVCDRVAQCQDGHCADGVCCDTACDGACDRCDGDSDGTCAALADGAFVATCGAYACDGGVACPTTCASDADCLADHYCDERGACVPDEVAGERCDDAAACASDHCSDGVCCDSDCDGACARCDLTSHVGACTLVADGAFIAACGVYACDGAASACPTSCATDVDCAVDHFCDAGGACVPDQDNGLACARATQCESDACVDGVCCNTGCDGACDRCDLASALGTCTNLDDGSVVAACGVYLCAGQSACPTSCAVDGDCTTDHVCENLACVALAEEGATCTRDAACDSTHCVGVLCCDEACDGPCEACDLDGLAGQCTPLDVGTLVQSCGDYRCDGLAGECPSACESDAACGPGTWCNALACVATLADGVACSRDAMCASGFCDADACITLAIDAPLDDALLATAKPRIDGRAPPGTSVTVKAGSQSTDVVADANGVWTWTPEAALPDGAVEISATLAGGATVKIEVTIDTTPPALLVQAPADGTIRPSGDVSVSGTSEAGAAIAVVIAATTRATITASNGAWSVDFTALADGPYAAQVTATDEAGNVASASTSFTVDTLAPTVSITAPDENSLSNVADVSVSGTGKAAGTLSLQHDGEAFTGVVAANGTWSIALGDVADGTWTDVVTITDGAARTANDEVTYTIDTTPPALAIVSPADEAALADPLPTLSGTSEPGVEVVVTLDGTVLATLTADAEGAWSTTPSEALAAGEHTLSVVARDAAGNTTELSQTFTLDGTTHLVGGSGCAGGSLPGFVLALVVLAMMLRRRPGATGGSR